MSRLNKEQFRQSMGWTHGKRFLHKLTGREWIFCCVKSKVADKVCNDFLHIYAPGNPRDMLNVEPEEFFRDYEEVVDE